MVAAIASPHVLYLVIVGVFRWQVLYTVQVAPLFIFAAAWSAGDWSQKTVRNTDSFELNFRAHHMSYVPCAPNSRMQISEPACQQVFDSAGSGEFDGELVIADREGGATNTNDSCVIL